MESVHDGCCAVAAHAVWVCARESRLSTAKVVYQKNPNTKSNKLSSLRGCVVEVPMFLAAAFHSILKPVRELQPPRR